jgi:hypothetical protein
VKIWDKRASFQLLKRLARPLVLVSITATLLKRLQAWRLLDWEIRTDLTNFDIQIEDQTSNSTYDQFYMLIPMIRMSMNPSTIASKY